MEGKFSEPNCPKSSNGSDKPPKIRSPGKMKGNSQAEYYWPNCQNQLSLE